MLTNHILLAGKVTWCDQKRKGIWKSGLTCLSKFTLKTPKVIGVVSREMFYVTRLHLFTVLYFFINFLPIFCHSSKYWLRMCYFRQLLLMCVAKPYGDDVETISCSTLWHWFGNFKCIVINIIRAISEKLDRKI